MSEKLYPPHFPKKADFKITKNYRITLTAIIGKVYLALLLIYV